MAIREVAMINEHIDDESAKIQKSMASGLEGLENTINATLYLLGCIGTVFTVKHNDNVYDPVVVTLTEEDYLTTNGDRYRIVPIPTGSYTITVELGEGSANVVVDVTERGTRYFVPYELTVFEKKTSGTKTLNLAGKATNVLITACGGGGGGAGANSPRAGGGGGGAACIIDELYNIPSGNTNIIVGSGGIGGKAKNVTLASAGGATVIGDVVTLGGGGAGDNPTAGTSGGEGGGVGGAGGDNSAGIRATNGQAGAKGSGGTTNTDSRQNGGGGGGSYGDGGDCTGVSSKGGDGKGYGAGGAGGGFGSDSQDGGDGYCGLVVIRKVVTSA